MGMSSFWAHYRDELASDPLLVLALSAALLAMVTTPLAFVFLGRQSWFQSRRGRSLQRPGFVAVVVGMVLTMAIPAVFAALVLKSRTFDRNRYEYDPNHTWSVLEQGRRFQSLEAADAGVKQEMERLGLVRKNLVEGVKKLDQALLAVRGVAGTSPAVAQRLPAVLQSLAGIRQALGLDGPQQLEDGTLPPADLQVIAPATAPAPATTSTAPVAAAPAALAPAGARNGLAAPEIAAELASVPAPQKAIAAMLPLGEVPSDWELGKPGDLHLETFNADNLYEKIDGRAESFLQYGVKGMAYAYFHPAGDASNEIQVYVYEMADGLKALGKYGSEKPDESKSLKIGEQSYTSAGSVFFYFGKYYTQIVSTQDDPRFAATAVELARRVAARQGAKDAEAPAVAAAPAATSAPVPAVAAAAPAPAQAPASTARAAPEGETNTTPATLFALLPAERRDGEPKYVAQDVFGYSFLSDVFMADYKDGEATWQGFLRPYRDADEARAMFQKYIEGVKKDGAEVKSIEAEGAEEMVVSDNIGLVDVVFRKGNTLAGANGGTSAEPAEAFARALAKSLPSNVPMIGNE